MKRRLLPVLALAFLLTIPLTAQKNKESADCCFVNPQYPGVCRVTPAENETCEMILEYLNTPGTVGKTYCSNTAIRGGWKRVDCSSETE